MATARRRMGIGARERVTGVTHTDRAAAGMGFNWVVVLLSLWMVGGAVLDGWAHNHVLEELETFFTPWHAAFYSGFAAIAAFVLGTVVVNHRRGYAWDRAIPVGYGLTVLGIVLFSLGGVGDMVWHTLFGIEADIEALLSPTHLLLALGGSLIVSGPLRSAWQQPDMSGQQDSRLRLLPAILSAALLLTLLTFMTQFAHNWSTPWAAESNRPATVGQSISREALGVSSILLQTGLLLGLTLLLLRRWPSALPMGSLALIFGFHALLLGLMRDTTYMVPSAILGGLVADALWRWLRPGPNRTFELRLFAFVVPAILYGLYFLTLLATGGIWWSVHVWTGAIVLAGVAGWLLSYVFHPPAIPAPDRR